jgi:F0F1-type ATP synthase assembly protein I
LYCGEFGNLAAVLAKRWRQTINQLLWLQVGLVAVISMLMLLVSTRCAYSALVAGAICLIANGWFIYRWLAKFSPLTARAMLSSFYRHEVAKLVIIVTLMLLALVKLHISMVPFLITYLLLQFSLLFIPVLMVKTVAKKRR